MAASRAAFNRHDFSTVSYKPFTSREVINEGDCERKLHTSQSDIGEIRKHVCLPKSCAEEQSFFKLGTQSLDRKQVKRTDSFGVSDWSRYSRGQDDLNDTEAANTFCKDNLSETATALEYSNFNNNVFDCSKKETHKSLTQSECPKANGDTISTVYSDHNKLHNNLDAQCTPTNIRRKLKSFEILPSFRRTGTDSTKITDNKNSQSEARCNDCSSGEDDNLDIVYPYTESTCSHQNRDVKFYLGKESDDETASKDTDCKFQEKFGGSADSREEAETKRYDGIVARFRKKQRLPAAGASVSVKRDNDRPTSAGTSGYSTDEYSCKVC